MYEVRSACQLTSKPRGTSCKPGWHQRKHQTIRAKRRRAITARDQHRIHARQRTLEDCTGGIRAESRGVVVQEPAITNKSGAHHQAKPRKADPAHLSESEGPDMDNVNFDNQYRLRPIRNSLPANLFRYGACDSH